MMEYNEFSPLFGEWAPKFKDFIEGKEMFKIYQRLKRDSEKEIIAPKSNNTFRVFATTSPNSVKSIWYMMDPYPRRYKNKALQATGIAMDCSNSPDGKMQPSLEKFYEGMEKDIGKPVERSLSLEYLSHQGVMMLNTDLTCKLGKSGSHEGLWAPFHEYFLGNVMRSTAGIVYVLAGKSSHKMEKYINPLGNYIIKLEHPVAASYKDTTWDHKNVFTRINTILKWNNNETIMWDKKEWDEHNDPPF